MIRKHRAFDIRENDPLEPDNDSPSSNAPRRVFAVADPSLREIAGRIKKLSFEDMLQFSTMLGEELKSDDPLAVAHALIGTCRKIETIAQTDQKKVTLR